MQIRRPGLPRPLLLLQKEADPYYDNRDRWLPPDLKFDPYAMHHLRELLAQSRRAPSPLHLTDDEVIFEINCLLAAGEAVFVDVRRRLTAGSSTQPEPPKSAPPPAGDAVKASKSEEPDPDTFSNVNGAVQAGALQAAAASGAPFCPH